MDMLGQDMLEQDMLEHTLNPFNGVVVNTDALPADPEDFRQQLLPSLEAWQARGHQVVWLELPIERARLVPVATEAGFRFHHSSEEALTLTYRLQPEALIPHFATHYIGAGGVVLNSRQELLVVCERHRRDRSRPYYKLPGGALHPGEHLVDAVIREVYEETGVQARFEALVCFRHWHGYRYHKSDIYFICRLSPISQEITIQPSEIEEACWMPVAEYLNSEYVSVFNKRIVQAALECPGIVPTWIDGYDDPARYEFFMPVNGVDGRQ
ncbi:NUDIX domain-containing protein [Litorilinea aerophila]|uniref:NUDIX domain-containing protein n=1 Tax=Litorilinea aerophila TaxID=1204385 RepID=A0A540VK45_9CHLR|nr:NUDIX domain-containing protein [Litorilinea aerophila]MCC9075232.1 NUDIX domain-containing protein [Litorilinea aerophila]